MDLMPIKKRKIMVLSYFYEYLQIKFVLLPL